MKWPAERRLGCPTLEPERGNARGGKMEEILTAISADLKAIRSKSPVILNVTNFVAMDLTANALLAIGASPIMAHAKEELGELVDLAESVVINIGTLDVSWFESMQIAVRTASERQKPVVLDPVGAGSSQFRTKSSRILLDLGGVTVVRGNASEIVALLGGGQGTRGVDSALPPEKALEVAQERSKKDGVVITISGETDYVVHQQVIGRAQNGDRIMAKVTAMGCAASSLIGAFLAVNPSPFRAALHAMAVMGICGEIAAKSAHGPGSFRTAFIDSLANLENAQMENIKIWLS